MVDDRVTCLNRRQQCEASEGKLAKRQSENQQRRRWKAALDLYLWGGHSCPPPLTLTFLWPRSNSKAGDKSVRPTYERGTCFPLRVNALPCISAARVTEVTTRGGLRAVFVRYLLPLLVRLARSPIPLSTVADNDSTSCVDRERCSAETERVTSARWHRGCIVYA